MTTTISPNAPMNGNVADSHEIAPSRIASQVMAEATAAREAQEVQAAMIVAKRFPRNELDATTRVIQACRRVSLAECSLYSYKRGGTEITGPSIRLAEALAKAWGNIDCGIKELEQRKGESTVMAYAWDLETNYRQTKVFTVPHKRYTKSGSYDLTDPRDIYETVANNGSRRLRACILSVIPGDVIESAVAECEKTLKGNHKEPLIDRVRKMLTVFQDDFQIGREMIEARLGHNAEAITEIELVNLKKVYQSIRDGFGKREEYFDVGAGAASNDEPKPSKTEQLKEKLKGAGKKTTEPRTESVAGVREDPAEHEERQPGDETEPTVDVDALVADLTAKVEEALKFNTAAARQEARAAIDANADALGLHYQRLLDMLESKAKRK